MRYRSLRNSLGFCLAALVLAIGGAIALFVTSILDAFLWKTPAHPGSPSLVAFVFGRGSTQSSNQNLPAATYLFLQTHNTTAAAFAGSRRELVTLGLEARAELLQAQSVTDQYFNVYGIRAATGRVFSEHDYASGQNVTVLSASLARKLFGDAARSIGARVRLNAREFVVIGVLPQLADDWEQTALWIPLIFTDRDRRDFTHPQVRTQVRLKPGRSLNELSDELAHLSREIEALAPNQVRGWNAVAVSWRTDFAAPVLPFRNLLIAAGLLSAILAGVNASSVLLSRATSRQRTLAIKQALGAPRRALILPFIGQAVVVAVVGATLGWGGAAVITHVIKVNEPSAAFIRLVDPFSIRGMVSAGALGVSYFIICGGKLARFALRVPWQEALRQSTISDRRVRRYQRWMAGFQIIVGVALVANTGQLFKVWQNLHRVPLGFVSDGLANFTILPANTRYDTPEKRVAFAEAIEAAVRAVPGVAAVGVTTSLPLVRSRAIPFILQGSENRPPAEWPKAIHASVSADYFAAMGIKLLSGSGFDASEINTGHGKAIINRTLAKQHFGEKDAVGSWIFVGVGQPTWRLIVGVADDVLYEGLQSAPTPQIYEPLQQTPPEWFSVVLRSSTVRTLPSPAVLQDAIARVDPEQPLGPLRDFPGIIARLSSRERITAWTFLAVSAVAVLLATTSLGSILLLQSLEREPEFAVRIMLGATQHSIVGLVLRDAMGIALPSALLGLFASHGLGMLAQTSVVGFGTPGFWDYSLAIAISAVVAVLVSCLPATRAAKIQPVSLLRQQ